jgi:hypothetical protein
MKKFNLFVLFVAFSLFTSRCALKPTASSAPTPGSPEFSAGEAAKPANPETVRSNRVSLVLGGAGVASFATVGFLKKLHEEGVEVDLIIATGWPALFALAAGYLKSIHDLEWFATRLGPKELDRMASSDPRQETDPSEALKGIVLNSFSQTLLSQSRIPVIIAATNTDLGEPDVFGTGDWKEPLLRTMGIPGLYRKFPANAATDWINDIQAMEIREAGRRGASNTIVLNMYEDFLSSVVEPPNKDEELSRRLYSSKLRKSASESMKLAPFSGAIHLKRAPLDFSAKRAAILAGYREAARILRNLREPASSTMPN